MSSFVFYRFKSQKEPSRISFDGTGISVWDLKKEIIQENKMGKGTDFDFAIYNADTEEEYTEDHHIIPRSTSVLARRLPPARPGRGNAQKYMPSVEGGSGPTGPGGAGSMQQGGGFNKQWNASQFTKRFDGKEDGKQQQPPGQPQEPVQVRLPVAAAQDEASALAAMFAASSQQWQQTQEQMAHATPVYRTPTRPAAPRPSGPGGETPAVATPGTSTGTATGTGTGAAAGVTMNRYQQDRQAFRYSEHKPPPPGYICYRCGQKGHWIQECPTNSDRSYDDRPRIKRTTGIPKSFLTVVEGPDAAPDQVAPGASGIMVTAEGGFVVARPDSASWLAHRKLTKNLTAGDVQNLAPTDPDLTCPVCSKLLRDAVVTPCCSTSFCQECVTNALMDNDMLCPECESRIKNVDKLKPDEPRRERVRKYIEDVVQASKDDKDGEGEGEDDDGDGVKKADGESKVEDGKDGDGKTVADGSDSAGKDGSTSGQTPTPAPAAPPPDPQQLMMQQQQQMMALMVARAGGPHMMMQQLQAQMMQLQMALQNPGLPMPVRIQMMAQMQMCQQQLVGVRMMMGAGPQQGGQGMGMPGMPGMAGPGNRPGFQHGQSMSPQQQQQQQQQQLGRPGGSPMGQGAQGGQSTPRAGSATPGPPANAPVGPASMTGAGVKRSHPDDDVGQRKKAEVGA